MRSQWLPSMLGAQIGSKFQTPGARLQVPWSLQYVIVHIFVFFKAQNVFGQNKEQENMEA